MDFGSFGIKAFTAETKAAELVRNLEQGRVVTTRCRTCGKVSFPPKFYCGTCGTDAVDWVEIEGPGRLETFTVVYYGPAGFEGETPYTLAVASFGDGIKMVGHMDKSVPVEDIKVGMDVRVVPATNGQNRWWYVFKGRE